MLGCVDGLGTGVWLSWGDVEMSVDPFCGVGGRPVGVNWSFGERSWVGEIVGPKLPFWLEVVMESDDVAVVVPWAGPSIFTFTFISQNSLWEAPLAPPAV